MEGLLPKQAMPFIEGDFNTCGWAENGDESIYIVLDRAALAAIPAKDGKLVFVWSDDDPGEIFGFVATLQHVTLGAFTGWRAQPVPGTFYRGPKPSLLAGGIGA
jgi:hypothetical protein